VLQIFRACESETKDTDIKEYESIDIHGIWNSMRWPNILVTQTYNNRFIFLRLVEPIEAFFVYVGRGGGAHSLFVIFCHLGLLNQSQQSKNQRNNFYKKNYISTFISVINIIVPNYYCAVCSAWHLIFLTLVMILTYD
jgi:hypothetical protein